MYRILSASKDAYITNKVISGQRTTTSNTGQAGTLDLFKLVDVSTIPGVTSSVVEYSRGLIAFDYSGLEAMPFLDISHPSFKCFLNLKDVYGGQTTPSNFELTVVPLSKSFTEGRGSDVIAFRDLDTCNYLTASVVNSIVTPWEMEGATSTGSLGETCDIIVSGNLGFGLQPLTVTQTFARGDEDLYVDVTTLVSATMAGIIANNGFRISYSDALETDSNTYFVKRFGTKQAFNKALRPRLIVKTTNDKLEDSMGFPQLDISQSLFVYNQVNDTYSNFFSGSIEITGSDCLTLHLEASKSYTYTTSSFSISHNATINHLTKSTATFSTYFSASQLTSSLGVGVDGIYSSKFMLSTFEPTFRDYLSGSRSIEFKVSWKSVDGSVTYAHDYATFNAVDGTFGNLQSRNWITNITNLKHQYSKDTLYPVRLRVFVQDYDLTQVAAKLAGLSKSAIVKNMKYRLKEAYTKKIVIPFDDSTALSYDRDGMYFDLWVSDLDVGEVYEIELLISPQSFTANGEDTLVSNKFRFKIVP